MRNSCAQLTAPIGHSSCGVGSNSSGSSYCTGSSSSCHSGSSRIALVMAMLGWPLIVVTVAIVLAAADSSKPLINV